MPTKMSEKIKVDAISILEQVSFLKEGLAILIDPQNFDENPIAFLERIPTRTHLLLVGGSQVDKGKTQLLVQTLKAFTTIPIVLFPGDYTQLTKDADAVLFLSLLSGRNPEYLIDQQIKAVDCLKNSSLEIIPTAYILIDGGCETSVVETSKTQPIAASDVKQIVNTALAGQFMGKKLIYLEAGSGAKNEVPEKVIAAVKKAVKIPIFVGGGIRTQQQIDNAYIAGANVVVMGTAFEK